MLLCRVIMKESNDDKLGNQEQLLEQEKLLEIERENPVYQAILVYLLQEAFREEKEPQYIKKDEIREWLDSLVD